MATSQTNSPAEKASNEAEQNPFASLPSIKGWVSHDYYHYQGFWIPGHVIQGVMDMQQHFNARDDDIMLVTIPKSGTTWLKSLAFSILNRANLRSPQFPLFMANSHDLVSYLEVSPVEVSNLLHSPRLLATHVPYPLLPESIKHSNCRIIYLCRNPGDNFVSLWHFTNKLRSISSLAIPMEKAFELFCNGTSAYGPFWDHVLGYWRKSIEEPKRVLFLKYEEMKRDTKSQVMKLAEFVRHPFSEEEEKAGVVEEILQLCSFDSLSNLEVNKTGVGKVGVSNMTYFRIGEIGDSAAHLTPQMIKKLNLITKQKLEGSCLTFEEHKKQ